MVTLSGIKAVLTDIEGTTSSISFVHDVLFPYARDHIPDYVRKNAVALEDIISDIRTLEGNETLDLEGVIAVLLRWIAEDKKITPLKTLQGMIWKEGYESGAFTGHIYDDAADMLQRWHDEGLALYIYSSGSIAAQKLIYGYSNRGDITPLLSGYFDTTTGPKLEPESYTKIAHAIGFPPDNILFLSDNAGEIAAADKAGMHSILIDREGKNPAALHDFFAITIQEKAA